ncbi:MAG: MgtC/SapB family protein [Actinobacteria bacterium]|nr:MgtC/SapB family protein [Actinomycetota bacterium]
METAPPVLSFGELMLRIGLAGLLGGLVGLEREFSDQPAGLRTHALVSFGAALFTMAGAYGVSEFFTGDDIIQFDPTRIAAQVVTGIGFIGAGAILRQGITVKGLTTAASLWVTASIGLAVGLGYLEGGVAVTAAALLVLYVLKQIERLLFPRLKRGYIRMRIELTSQMRLSDLTEVVEAHSARIDGMKINTDGEERHLVARLQLPPGLGGDVLAEEISSVEGVTAVDWQP